MDNNNILSQTGNPVDFAPKSADFESGNDRFGFGHASKLLDAIESHIFTSIGILFFAGYIFIAATGNMKTDDDFDRYFCFSFFLFFSFGIAGFLSKFLKKK